MRKILLGTCILLAMGLGVRTMADDGYDDDGQVIVKKVYRQPLTTSRVNTTSTRAVDARRAAESGLFVRPPTRAYVVTNPLFNRSIPTRYEPKAEHKELAPVVRVQPMAHPDRPVVIAEFVTERTDPLYDNTGAVRAQPPVARAQNPIDPAYHRAYPTAPNRVYHVTADSVIGGYEPAPVSNEPMIYLLYPDGVLYPAPGYGVWDAGDDRHHHW